VQTKAVVSSPANGSPQRSQNGGRMKRTCDQHWLQTKPLRASARLAWHNWQTGGYNKSNPGRSHSRAAFTWKIYFIHAWWKALIYQRKMNTSATIRKNPPIIV
jgi:hypothetical protein